MLNSICFTRTFFKNEKALNSLHKKRLKSLRFFHYQKNNTKKYKSRQRGELNIFSFSTYNLFVQRINNNYYQKNVVETTLKYLKTISKNFILKKLAKIEILLMTLNYLKIKKGTLSRQRIFDIRNTLWKGTFTFKPVFCYKIPKKWIQLNKVNIGNFLKNKTILEKKSFFKNTRKKKAIKQICVEYKCFFEEPVENKIVAKAIELIIKTQLRKLNFYPNNLFSYKKKYNLIN